MTHYGEKFLEALKAESMYGDLFPDEEYQQLKTCDSRASFATLWGNIKYGKTPVYQAPADTLTDLRLEQAAESHLSGIGNFFLFDWLSIVFIPLFPFWAAYCYISYRSKMASLNRFRKRTFDPENRKPKPSRTKK